MGPIVCATRGGEASRRNQEQAISLAKERGVELIFLYVVDSNFIETVDEALREALRDELRQLGTWLLRIAQTRAKENNLVAQTVVREGTVQECLEAYIREVHASALVIGSPRVSAHPNAFGRDELNSFAAAIQSAIGVEVIVVN